MEQITFLCWTFCIIMTPEGQLIHWNLFSVGGGKPKIAASDCHTIGLDCAVQLCSEPVCLSFNWLLYACQPIRCIITGIRAAKRATKFIPNSFQKYMVKKTKKNTCVNIEYSVMQHWAKWKRIPLFDYHNATEFKAWFVQLQIGRETTPTPPFHTAGEGWREEDGHRRRDSRAVLVNYPGASVIKHPSTSEAIPPPARAFVVAFRAHKRSITRRHNNLI